jgi:hypothetical protein
MAPAVELIDGVGTSPCCNCALRDACATGAACFDYHDWLVEGVVHERHRYPTQDIGDYAERRGRYAQIDRNPMLLESVKATLALEAKLAAEGKPFIALAPEGSTNVDRVRIRALIHWLRRHGVKPTAGGIRDLLARRGLTTDMPQRTIHNWSLDDDFRE